MWQARFTPDALKSLERLNKPAAQQVFSKIQWMTENFDSLTPEPLTGKWQGTYKLRAGDYRVLYTIERTDLKIVIHVIGHRREIYKLR